MPGTTEELLARLRALTTLTAPRVDGEAAALIGELAARIAELEAAATLDPLTGILNRRGFDAALAGTLARAERSGQGGVLVMIDLDGFKPVNDAFGHAAGDAVLSRVARLLTESTRASDAVARIGGDEFAVLLPETDRADGLKRAEALAASINSAVAMWRGRPIRLAASVGVHAYGAGADGGRILEAADAAMYRIKSARPAANHAD